jgi:hypothetical protein
MAPGRCVESSENFLLRTVQIDRKSPRINPLSRHGSKPLFGENPSAQLPNGGIPRKQFYVGPENPGHFSCDPGQAGQFRSKHIQGHSGTHTLRTQYEMGGYGATPAAVDCDAATRFTSLVPHRNEPRNGGPMMSFPRDA